MKKISQIQHIWLNLTSQCNNRCDFCYDCGNTNYNFKIDGISELAKKIFIINPKDIILIGGEPTLHPNFQDIVKIVSQVNNNIVTISNGTMLCNKSFVNDSINNGCRAFILSLISCKPSIHDFVTHRKGSWKEIMDSFYNLYPIYKNGTIGLSFSTTINKLNYDHLEDIFDFVIGLGMPNVHYNVCIPSLNPQLNSLCLSPFEVAEVIQKIYIYSKYKKSPISIASSVPRCLYNQDIFDEMIQKKVISSRGCQIFSGTGYQILSNGDVTPCTHLFDTRLFNINASNDSKDNLLEQMNCANAKKFRHNINKYPAMTCQSCNYWGECMGGCPIFWTFYDPETFIKGIQ